MASSLDWMKLHSDLVLSIFKWCSLKDLIALREVCHRYRKIIHRNKKTLYEPFGIQRGHLTVLVRQSYDIIMKPKFVYTVSGTKISRKVVSSKQTKQITVYRCLMCEGESTANRELCMKHMSHQWIGLERIC